MPAKHTIRLYEADGYYHVYNRGVAKLPIFLDHADRYYFLGLFSRHLDPGNDSHDTTGSPYPKFDTSIEILAYCLMRNHFHLLLRLGEDTNAITEFMRCLSTAYTMYFNRKYKRVDPLFQGRFKASKITNDAYLIHISRYIHLNPHGYKTYEFSSLPDYLGEPRHIWIKPAAILSLFGPDEYLPFLEDYETNKQLLEAIKSELADS